MIKEMLYLFIFFQYVPQDLVNGVEVINEEPEDYITLKNNKNYYNAGVKKSVKETSSAPRRV